MAKRKNSNEIWIELLKGIIFNSPFGQMLDERELYRLKCKHLVGDKPSDFVCQLKNSICDGDCKRMKNYDKKH